ncbi:hypothetical protein [Enterobacter sp. RHBSTW-01064]|nr:hypothetical protein [Enterobacter sp. RHBSTW-01064]
MMSYRDPSPATLRWKTLAATPAMASLEYTLFDGEQALHERRD